ncbi:MAG TPA: hypothetical protein EYM95_13250, partial [Candidatus Obscuribacterales bacterium]|nr:hypothetical protein [Candidatus Obscuribacterales bacterium]
MSSISKELAELLVDNGLLSDEDLQQVEQEKEKTGEPLRIILERLNLATEKQLKNTLELQYGVNYLALHTISPELPVVDLLPAEVISEHGVVPIHIDGNRLTVAMINPDDAAAMKAVKASVKMDVKPLVCFEDDFRIFLDQIEKMRHMPDRQVAPVDDSEFGTSTEAAQAVESGVADDTTGEIIEELPSEEFAVDEATGEEIPSESAGQDVENPSEHEAADAVDFHQAEQEFAGAEYDSDEVTSDTVAAAPSLTSGSYSAQYDTGSLDSIATPKVPSEDLEPVSSEPFDSSQLDSIAAPSFDASALDSIPTPNIDAGALDSIPTPKSESAEPAEKPQLGGIASFFKGGGGAPKKAASDPSQERSGGLSALRGMMGGKKGGKKNELSPAQRPAPPPPPPPPAPTAPAAAEGSDDTAGGAEETQGKSGLLSSKLGSAAHQVSSAKKFLKEKRSDSQPVSPQEQKDEAPVPEWMNEIDENTPIETGSAAEQTGDTAEEFSEQSLTATEEQAVNDYYAELGFDPDAEAIQPESSTELPEPTNETVSESESTTATEQEEQEGSAASYEVPPMDPAAAGFMSWSTEQAESEGQAVSDALAEASEAL